VTLSSGLIASLDGLINNPTSIPNILATNLPQASTFFLTYVSSTVQVSVIWWHLTVSNRYIVLQGLSGVAGGFLQIVRLIIYYVKLFILGSTPRSVYSIKYIPGGVAWGTLFPSITLLVVISMCFSWSAKMDQTLTVFIFILRNSTWILYHFACHQRTCLRRVLFVLSAVQVSFLVCVPTTHYNRHWRPILSQSPATHLCGPLRPTSVPLCAVLPC